MTIIEWDDNLKLGIEEIDKQHKHLVKQINDLAEAVLQRKGKDTIIKTLRFMENYAELHFSTEEKFMEEHNYSGLEEQKKEHERFRGVVSKLMDELQSEELSESTSHSVQRYLIDWLILHIKEKDLAFGDYLKETENELK
ncbi:MAG: hemerythrin family protein [Thermoplasmata archaeon]|nr:MAG: hemerythrin family protein [Thermoplasmata archaeon]